MQDVAPTGILRDAGELPDELGRCAMVTCPKCGTPAENETAGFCTKCGQPLDQVSSEQHDSAPAAPVTTSKPVTAREAATAPIALQINDGRFYMEDWSGVLNFRLCNRTEQRIDQANLQFRANYLGDLESERLYLMPRETVACPVSIVPQRPGEHLVRVTLSFQRDGRTEVWQGHALFLVLAKQEPIDKIQLTIDQSTKLSGDKIGFGQSIRNEVHEGILKGLIRDANDLMRQEYTPSWQDVSLRRANAPVPPLTVVEELAQRGPLLDKASLVFSDQSSGSRVLLLGQSEVRLGRNRREDIVLRRFPRSKIDDPRTLQIQTRTAHMSIVLRPAGLFLVDHKTENGTWLNGRRLAEDTQLALEHPSEVDVGHALQLRLTPHCGGGSKAAADDEVRYKCLGLPDEAWEIAERLGLRALLIERVDNLAREERYLIVYRWAVCGRELGLFLPGLADEHFRIVRIHGGLWLEGRVDEQRLVVAGTPVGSGNVFPLSAGMTLRCGQSEGRVEMFRQFGL